MGERKPDPEWSVPAPLGAECTLEVVKGGTIVDKLVIAGPEDPAPERHCHLFGRTPMCVDFVMDHASTSR